MSRPNLVDTEEEARRIRETFVDRESGSRKRMPFTWPKRLQVIGKCVAVEYRSDKWKQRREWDEYKHIAEAPQEFLACKDFLTPWEKPTHPIKVHGPTVELLQPMPKHFAELAPLLGVQVQLFGPGGKVQGDQGIVEVRVTRGMLGGAKHPKNGAPFLIIYSPSREDGMHAIITGSQLDIERDGITG